MSQRRGEVMTRKSPGSAGKRYNKRGTYSDHFESQDIWKNLDRIRHSDKLAGKAIRNSFICVKFQQNINLKIMKDCITELHKYIEQDTLELKQIKHEGNDRYMLILKNFTVLDCCLSLVVISNLISGNVSKSSRNLFLTIPIEPELSCTIFILSSCKYIKNRYMFHRDNANFKVSTSTISTIPNLKEIRISTAAGKSLSHFIQGLANLLSDIKFGKYPRNISNSICSILWNPERQLSFGLSEMRYLQNGLQNPDAMLAYNRTLTQSQKELDIYRKELREYTKSLTRDKSETTSQSGVVQNVNTNSETSVLNGKVNRANVSRETSDNQNGNGNARNEQFNKPGFLSQDDIKEHCIATISASRDSVMSKNPQEIFKMYIRVPKLKYTDIIYQNLNDLRNKTKCNIVVLNLNNLHESEQWLESLDIKKYTTVVQLPHPSTVRVVSIGGVSEYILTTLDLISDIMKS
ncbi:hypothetical protein C6P45_004256 [Maudiozyma exigua]|uniref:Uncharacterized protein n=1 Tax=Maudiozyma exigua TaxID=34358 RepID=A0A9P7BBQ5_MAUEX|nr:hypothetical protein C6P45_004256 [Kazachstania exigua]